MNAEVTVENKSGLHARPASIFVQTAQKFKSSIKVEKDGRVVDGKSIMGILSLGAVRGSRIKISTEGVDEENALSSLVGLLKDKFSEE